MASFFMTALKIFQRGEEEPPKGTLMDGKVGTLPNGMAREELEEYQQQLLEQKIERDKASARKKAGQAAVRMHLRDKYHLAQDERDDAQLRVAGGTAALPQELAATVQGAEEEDGDAEIFIFLTNLREVALPAPRGRARGGADGVKEKCSLM